MRGVEVFSEDASAVSGGEDEDCVDLWGEGVSEVLESVWRTHVRI